MDNIMKKIKDFNKARGWSKFHTLPNLIQALSIEVSELQEIFLWGRTCKYREHLENELADCFIYLLTICDLINMDESEILKAIERKIEINGDKYPVDKCYGRNDKCK